MGAVAGFHLTKALQTKALNPANSRAVRAVDLGGAATKALSTAQTNRYLWSLPAHSSAQIAGEWRGQLGTYHGRQDKISRLIHRADNAI